MLSFRTPGRLLPATIGALLSAVLLALTPAAARAGQPLVLDTQHGISDGQSGIVLQNAPLSHAPMVEAQQSPAPYSPGTNSSTPIVVAPYIELPGGGSRPMPPPRPKPQPLQP